MQLRVVIYERDYLAGCIHSNRQPNKPNDEIFYFHGNHLGSASWITIKNGALQKTKEGCDFRRFRGAPTEEQIQKWINDCASEQDN